MEIKGTQGYVNRKGNKKKKALKLTTYENITAIWSAVGASLWASLRRAFIYARRCYCAVLDSGA